MSVHRQPPLVPTPHEGTLAEALDREIAEGATALFWLGQAGFALASGGRLLLIDPYLSDSLAEKYRGRTFAHERMMPAPIAPGELPRLDWVLLTHRHGDHMDLGTLPLLATVFPTARFVFPEADRAEATRRIGLPEADRRLVGTDAGETLDLGCDQSLIVFPAAHETPERDTAGRHRFLGYGLALSGLRIWHSGDCVPFAGLDAPVRAFAPDVALLPVNGRDPALLAAGVPGNFTLGEAIDAAVRLGARQLLAHHYGLFAFNTCDPALIDAAVGKTTELALSRSRLGIAYRAAGNRDEG